MGKIIEEPFHLTDSDGNITAADGTASIWSDVWKYQVPQGVTHLLKPNHTISAYLKDTGAAEVTAPACQVKIEVRDASEESRQPIFGPAMYNRITEFQNQDLIAKLSVPAGGLKVTERQWIIFMVYDDVATDASESYFDLFINQIRETLV